MCTKSNFLANLRTSYFNIFRLREKDIPVDAMELKDEVVAFNFEPLGRRFAIIHGGGVNLTAGFYTMKKNQIVLDCRHLVST